MQDILLPSNRVARLRNAYRYPDEAALLARIPLVGRRVPLRRYWQHRPIKRERLWREMLLSSPVLGAVARRFVHVRGLPSRVDATRMAVAELARDTGQPKRARVAALPGATRRAPERGAGSANAGAVQRRLEKIEAAAKARDKQLQSEIERLRKQLGRRHWWRHPSLIVAAVSAGALAMYYFDATSGRRRRALLRDRYAHIKRVLLNDVPERAEKRGRFFRGVARGIRHDAAGIVAHDGASSIDDETLVARVRSEVLGRREIKAGEIHLDAYAGTVTLRGQLQYPDEIRRLIEDTSRVDGVRRVRSYLHLPGTLAPNKAEIYELERAPGERP